MTLKAFLKLALPPFVLGTYRAFKRATSSAARRFVYAPHGWETRLPLTSGHGYESAEAIAAEREGWLPFIRAIENSPTWLVSDRSSAPSKWQMACDHNIFMTYGYVLALAAQRKDRLKVLDYGGSLGEFCFVGRALLPDVPIEYHCKELPEMARAGREINPGIIWHTDDSCFEAQYDLVMFSGSLQYIRNWREVLQKASRATRDYLYLTSVSIVESVPGFVAVQEHARVPMLYQVINKKELFSAIDGTGLRLMREFWMEDPPYIINAPEQPSSYRCLLKRLT